MNVFVVVRTDWPFAAEDTKMRIAGVWADKESAQQAQKAFESSVKTWEATFEVEEWKVETGR